MRTRPLIAVVNDDTTFLTLLHELLSTEGYQVLAHREGNTAYELIKREQPDLVILDIRMEHPEMGWDVLEILRLDPATTHVPVLVCSADLRQLREHAEYLRTQGYDVLAKPFDLEALLAKVAAVVGPPQPPA